MVGHGDFGEIEEVQLTFACFAESDNRLTLFPREDLVQHAGAGALFAKFIETPFDRKSSKA